MTGNADSPQEVVVNPRMGFVVDDDEELDDDDLDNLLNRTDNDGTDSDGTDTPTPTDNDGTDSDGVDTPTPYGTGIGNYFFEPQKLFPITWAFNVRRAAPPSVGPVSLTTQEATTVGDSTFIFDADAAYRILTIYGSTTEIDLSDFLPVGTSGITFALKSCDTSRSDYYDSVAVEDGKLLLTSNSLGHVHGPNTESETVCVVTGTGESGSEDREFRLYTVSDRTPGALSSGALSFVEARATEIDVRVNAPGAFSGYLRVGWRKTGGQPNFGIVSGVNDGTVLTISGLEAGADYEIRAYIMSAQGYDLYRAGNTASTGELVSEGNPESKWVRNLAGGGLGKSQTVDVATAPEPVPTSTPIPEPIATSTPQRPALEDEDDSDGIDTPTPTDNDDTDSDGIDTPTPTDNDGTDSDGIDTPTPTDNDGTDSDGIDTTGMLVTTDNDGTDSDGIDTPTPTDNDGTDSDGIDTPTPTDNDGTDSDGIDTPTPTDNDGTDSDGIDTPTPTDNDGTDSDGIDTPTPTDNDGTDSDGIDTPTPTDNDGTDSDGIDTPTPTDNDGTDSDGIDTPSPQTPETPDSGDDSDDNSDVSS